MQREGGGEQVRADAVGVGRDRDRAQAGGAQRRDRAEVGRRLDEDRLAGRGEGAERGRQRGLAAGADDDVVAADVAAGLAREPLAQRLQALDREAAPRLRPARGAAERGAQRGDRLKIGMEVPTGERDRAIGREGEQRVERRGLQRRPVGERDLLPAEVRRPLGRDARFSATNVPRPGRGIDEPLAGQARQRALHGDR